MFNFYNNYFFFRVLAKTPCNNLYHFNSKQYSTKYSSPSETNINPNIDSNVNEAKVNKSLKTIYDHFLKEIGPLIYHDDKFYIKKETHYVIESNTEFMKRVKNFIGKNYPSKFSPSNIENLTKLLEMEFIVNSDSFNDGNYLNFLDGSLNLHTNILENHSESRKFTYVQPYNYHSSKDIEPHSIIKFLSSCVSEDQDKLETLLALTYCIVTNLTKFEVFLEIVGSGSTGKSTYINLIRALINPIQATATTMKDLEGNRFESMNIQGKKLIYIADSEAYKGGGGKLKSLVSGDSIRAEKKFKDITHFSVKAFFVFVGNYPITSTDVTSGMIRRRILFNFNNISKSREKLIEINNNLYHGPLSNEIPGFINYLITNKEVYLAKLSTLIGNVSVQNENYIFSFFNEYLIIDKEGLVFIGNNSKPFYSSKPKLYPLFLFYCKANKVKPISLFKFIETFLDWSRVNSVHLEKLRDKANTHYSGVKLNTDNLNNLTL